MDSSGSGYEQRTLVNLVMELWATQEDYSSSRRGSTALLIITITKRRSQKYCPIQTRTIQNGDHSNTAPFKHARYKTATTAILPHSNTHDTKPLVNKYMHFSQITIPLSCVQSMEGRARQKNDCHVGASVTDAMKRCKQATLVLTSTSVGENISKEGMLNASPPTQLLIRSWASYNRTTGPSHLDKSLWRKFRPRAILLHVCSHRRGNSTLLCVVGIYSWPNLENSTTIAWHVHFMLVTKIFHFMNNWKSTQTQRTTAPFASDWL